MEKDPTEYADGMNPYQAYQSNPINRVDPTGLLSQLEVAGVVYNETSGLRPAWKDPKGPKKSTNYDPASEAQLAEAREWIAGIVYQEKAKTAKPKIPSEAELKNDDVRRAWEGSKAAAAAAKGKDYACDHFVIWTSDDGKTPSNDPPIKDKWPYTEADKIVKVFGPFRTPAKVGDAPQSDKIYVIIYKGVK